MFRFLDKRFYRRSQLDFDLRVLACEHIGLSRTYAPTELKRKLKPALEELEQVGFLEPLAPEERYSWVARGNWRILLIRGRAAQGQDVTPADDAAELVKALVERGITAKSAAELVEAHPLVRVRTKLEVFDWLVKNEDKRVGKNPAGYLVASIRSDYRAPDDFEAAKRTAAKTEQVKAAAEVEKKQKRKQKEDQELAKSREIELRERWERLSEADREALVEVVKAENPGIGRWKNMLEPLCLAALEKLLVEKGEMKVAESQKTLFPDVD